MKHWKNFAADFGGYAIDVGPAIMMFFDRLEDAQLADWCMDHDVPAERCGLQITVPK